MKRQGLLCLFFAVAVSLFLCCGLSYAITVDVGSSGNPGTYSTIQNGYNAAAMNGGGGSSTIQVQTGTYVENDRFASNILLSLIGGYNSNFSSNSDNSYATIEGTLTITNGTTTAKNIIILVPTLVSIAITPVNPSIAVGATDQFTATGTYSNNTTQNITSSVTWSSSVTSVATINTSGIATAVAAGTSTIIATSGNISGSTTLAVNPPTLVSIAITPVNPSIVVGGADQFMATGTYSNNIPQNITSSVTWTSSAPSVATINTSGIATAVAAGTSTIIATSGNISGSTTLAVNPPTLVSIAITPVNPSIAVGATDQFTATGTYSNNTTQNITSSVTWSSSVTSVATINTSGIATAIAVGSTTITATSGNISGSTSITVNPSGNGNNVLSLTVNGSTCDSTINAGYTNDPCVSLTVCTPGTSNCVTINSILLDTGSFGLRIFQSLLGSVSLTPIASGSGSLAECAYFGGGTSDWGPVEMADIIMGNEPAVTIPIQVIESTYPTIPSSCSTRGGFTTDTSPAEAGFNGILGVGPLVPDCGTTCVTSTATANYYSCSGSRCRGATVPLSQQVSNPVASLPVDNNGLIVELPNVPAGGLASLNNGSLVLGIGTQSNNTPAGVTTYPLDPTYGYFITTFSGATFGSTSDPLSNGGSFIDTGSTLLYFPSPTSGTYNGDLPDCTGVDAGLFCPNSTTSFQATIMGATGSPTGTVSFQIGNSTTLLNSSNNVFGNLGADSSSSFDWGLPFYFGKNVFIGFEGFSSGLGSGPYFAY